MLGAAEFSNKINNFLLLRKRNYPKISSPSESTEIQSLFHLSFPSFHFPAQKEKPWKYRFGLHTRSLTSSRESPEEIFPLNQMTPHKTVLPGSELDRIHDSRLLPNLKAKVQPYAWPPILPPTTIIRSHKP